MPLQNRLLRLNAKKDGGRGQSDYIVLTMPPSSSSDLWALAATLLGPITESVTANLNHEMTGTVIDEATQRMAEALAETSDEAMSWGQDRVYSADAALVEDAREAGLTVIDLTAEERSAFSERLDELPSAFADKWKDGVYEAIVETNE